MSLVIYFSKGLTGVLFKLKCKMKNKDKHSHLTHSQSLLTITVTTHTHSQSPLILTVTTNTRNHHSNSEPPQSFKTTYTCAHTTHLNSSNMHIHTIYWNIGKRTKNKTRCSLRFETLSRTDIH
jgi:hypothetical protein